MVFLNLWVDQNRDYNDEVNLLDEIIVKYYGDVDILGIHQKLRDKGGDCLFVKYSHWQLAEH